MVVPNGSTVLQCCEEVGEDIPRFCYHDRLSIAGNCRMCLVEVEKSPKPVASCAMPAMPGMVIKTDTPLVKKAREGVMEFLLANHPLDCPICDQGGECDLQDQSMEFGSDRSRFKEFKRSVEDKNIGPLVKTVMTRCIHCTRCVRFATEVAGVEALGATGRGNQMEIGTYVPKVFDSELSGNVVDLCPVGALTSRPFAFTSRPWELKHTESIDVFDGVGSNIRIDTRGAEIMRVLPRLHEDVNEEWLSDKSRYAYDGLKHQRLDTPMIKENGELKPVSWGKAFAAIKKQLKNTKSSQIKAIAGGYADAESLISLKDMIARLGSRNIELAEDTTFNADLRSAYTFSSSIAGIEDSDAILLVGSNPRMEAPLVNARIRKMWRNVGTQVAAIGPKMDLTYKHQNLGANLSVLDDIISGKNDYAKFLKEAERPLIVVGTGVFREASAEKVYGVLTALAKAFPNLVTPEWNGINFLQLTGGRTAALDIGFVPGPESNKEDAKFVYLLAADDGIDGKIPDDAFVVYQGHHGDKGAARANVILPAAAYTEKEATYVNTEGRVQHSMAATALIGDARADWQIIRALSEVLGPVVTLPYNNLEEVRNRLADVAPQFASIDVVEPSVPFTAFTSASKAGKVELKPAFANFWMTDPVTRVSKTMAKASAELPTASNSYL